MNLSAKAMKWMSHHPKLSVIFLFIVGFLLMWLYKPWLHALGDMVAAAIAGAVIDIVVMNKEKEAGEID